jgi:protein TonB
MRSYPPSLTAFEDSAAREQALTQYALMLQRVLSDSLRAHPSYPREALREGLEGTARVALRFAPEGVLREVSVESSSGHAILDQAAMRFVQALVLPNVPPRLRESGFDLSLPVSFRLAKPVQAQRQPLPVQSPH